MKGLFDILNFWLFSSLLIQHIKLRQQERVRVEHSQGFVADTSSWNLGLLGQFSIFILKSNTIVFQQIREICQRKCSLLKCFINTAVGSQRQTAPGKKKSMASLGRKGWVWFNFWHDTRHLDVQGSTHFCVLLSEIIEMEDKIIYNTL